MCEQVADNHYAAVCKRRDKQATTWSYMHTPIYIRRNLYSAKIVKTNLSVKLHTDHKFKIQPTVPSHNHLTNSNLKHRRVCVVLWSDLPCLWDGESLHANVVTEQPLRRGPRLGTQISSRRRARLVLKQELFVDQCYLPQHHMNTETIIIVLKTRSIWKTWGPFATTSRLTPIHQMSLAVLSRAACASMSTTTRDRVDRYGPWNGPNNEQKSLKAVNILLMPRKITFYYFRHKTTLMLPSLALS